MWGVQLGRQVGGEERWIEERVQRAGGEGGVEDEVDYLMGVFLV